jgi:putative tryptophan/tyrosine transport system substrate-binding protein
MFITKMRTSNSARLDCIGVLLPATTDNAEFQARVGAFLQGLQQSGWSIGRNVRIDTRWATANAADIRRHAAELAALAPDVILAHGTSTVGPLLQATRTVPIVFPVVAQRTLPRSDRVTRRKEVRTAPCSPPLSVCDWCW